MVQTLVVHCSKKRQNNIKESFRRSEEERLKNLPQLIKIGSCALHIVHGTFESGSN